MVQLILKKKKEAQKLELAGQWKYYTTQTIGHWAVKTGEEGTGVKSGSGGTDSLVEMVTAAQNG